MIAELATILDIVAEADMLREQKKSVTTKDVVLIAYAYGVRTEEAFGVLEEFGRARPGVWRSLVIRGFNEDEALNWILGEPS